MKKTSSAGISRGLLIGLTLFSMFFGAGNLIFAPFLGVQAGTQALPALTGFILTAAVCPIAAVLILSRYHDAWRMLSGISPYFALMFMTLIYLMIGPCVAIPRTATTSFEMFSWLWPDTLGVRIVYSVVFFAAAGLLARHPSALKDVLGRILTPVLIILVLLICVGSLLQPASSAAPQEAYASMSWAQGMTDGYQTMDILAAYCFGPVLLINIRSLGPLERKERRSIMSLCCLTAGLLLACIYGLLGFCAARQAGTLQTLSNGAQVLSVMAEATYGRAGQVICALIFLIACFNVCTGLLCCCAAFFQERYGGLSYDGWLLFFTLVSLGLSLFGLDTILQISSPMLSILCPIALFLLLWGAVRLACSDRVRQEIQEEEN